jgi:hypothetical protein
MPEWNLWYELKDVIKTKTGWGKNQLLEEMENLERKYLTYQETKGDII